VAHVPPERLPRYRQLKAISEKLDALGGQVSGLGDYHLANQLWHEAGNYQRKAFKLRVEPKLATVTDMQQYKNEKGI
jgi:hypothetical protein